MTSAGFEALRASEQRLQDILDNGTAVVSVKDLELYILVNREYERRFQVQRDQIRGKTDYDVLRDIAETVRANDRQVIDAGTPLQSEIGEERSVGILAMFSRKAVGQDTLEALEAVADTIAHSIERKRAEEELARLNRTLQTLYRCNQALVCATSLPGISPRYFNAPRE